MAQWRFDEIYSKYKKFIFQEMTQPSIIVAGDLCLRARTQFLSSNRLSVLFQDIKPIIQSADAAMVNLETAVLRDNKVAIPKTGPVIATDKRVLELIKEVGFSGVTLANNHFADYGAEGVEESLRLIEQHKLWYVGAGMNADDAAEVKFLQVGNKEVAIINACEHEFTIATDYQAGCNALNPIRQFNAIQKAEQKADFVLVIIHGGVEHYYLPTPRMQETYRFFIEAGADAVVNHHQHCFSGYEIYQDKPIVYGLGNFFFDWQGQDANWNKGYMVKLTFDKKIGIELIPYIQNAETLGMKLMEDSTEDEFFATINELNAIISKPEQLQSHFASWVGKKKNEYLQILQPKIGKNIKRLDRWHLISESQRTNWISEYMTDDRRKLLKSLFQCESHQDVMNEILKLQ